MALAFDGETKMDAFYMSDKEPGTAHNSFAEAANCLGESFESRFKQSAVGFSVDDFIEQYAPPFPNHIKIDVDGIEPRIIKGAQRTLTDGRVRSLLVELEGGMEEGYIEGVVEMVEACGLKCQKKVRGAWCGGSNVPVTYNFIFVRS